MSEKYLIDIGSSTIKVYYYNNILPQKISEKSIDFKSEFNPEIGLSSQNKTELFMFFNNLKNKYGLDQTNTKIFATGIFRDINHAKKNDFIEEFYEQLGLYFNIISHDLEALYLEKAWIGKYHSSKSVLIINIGGKTAELILMQNSTVLQKLKIELGVGTILKKYPKINNEFSEVELSQIVDHVSEILPDVNMNAEFAIYTGGELNYMKIANYNLITNNYFADNCHPVMISYQDYCSRNNQIFKNVTINELRELMPDNPAWMDGARACSSIAQTICKKYGIEFIVPSDSNLIDGACLQEFKNAVICGSFNKHLDKINNLALALKKMGVSIVSPSKTEVVGSQNGFVLFHGEVVKNNCTWPIERKHLKAIEQSDVVIICNYDNYIGYSTSIELGYALGFNKKIVFVENNEVVRELKFPCEIGLI